METRHGPAAETVQLRSCSDRFLKAAACLPREDADMALPRLELMARALVYRLKAFIRAARGGTPGTDDLGRLTDLAVHCGLALSQEEHVRIVSFADVPADVTASLAWVGAVCQSLDAQMSGLADTAGD